MVISDDPRPPYVQVADSLRRAIATGELRAGQKLPAGRLLAKQYEVSPNTAQRAVELLKAEGALVSFPPRGVFVASEGSTTDESADVEPDHSAEYIELVQHLDRMQRDFRDHIASLEQRITDLEDRIDPAATPRRSGRDDS